MSFTTLWNHTILKRIYKYLWKCKSFTTLWNHTILKRVKKKAGNYCVLLPYEITLFSNFSFDNITFDYVLLPYEITLFSNKWHTFHLLPKFYYLMKSHYSQTAVVYFYRLICFTTLWNHTILKLWSSDNRRLYCFTTLWNHTILKRSEPPTNSISSFTTLWNHTILKPTEQTNTRLTVLLPYEITLFSNLVFEAIIVSLFYYLMKSHYSQTNHLLIYTRRSFYYLMKSHYSQTDGSNKYATNDVLLPYEITLFSN